MLFCQINLSLMGLISMMPTRITPVWMIKNVRLPWSRCMFEPSSIYFPAPFLVRFCSSLPDAAASANQRPSCLVRCYTGAALPRKIIRIGRRRVLIGSNICNWLWFVYTLLFQFMEKKGYVRSMMRTKCSSENRILYFIFIELGFLNLFLHQRNFYRHEWLPSPEELYGG